MYKKYRANLQSLTSSTMQLTPVSHPDQADFRQTVQVIMTQVIVKSLRDALMAMLCLSALLVPALAQSVSNPSGLPLPRFVTTRSEPINVRVGPGTRYDVAWVFIKAGQPVEIIQEFDTWRKVRDVDGDEGWVHQNLLASRRAGLVTPWASEGQIALRTTQSMDAPVRAWLTPGFRVEIDRCNEGWCTVSATFAPEGSRSRTFSGFIPQTDLWGVYPNETFS